MAEEKKYKYTCEMCRHFSNNAEDFYKCIQCNCFICFECKIEEDICPNCAPHSLEEVNEWE